MMRPEEWLELARCRGVNTDVFFPTAGGGDPYKIARGYCNRCPVRMACLEDALRAERHVSKGSGMRHGMYGGTTPDERAGMKWIYDLKVTA